MKSQEKTKPPKSLRPLFWDVVFEELVVEKHAFLIIKRISDLLNSTKQKEKQAHAPEKTPSS